MGRRTLAGPYNLELLMVHKILRQHKQMDVLPVCLADLGQQLPDPKNGE